jgi:nitroreductase/dihydropteridine reductase
MTGHYYIVTSGTADHRREAVMHSYIEALTTRYTTKKFDPDRRLDAETVQAVKDILQLSPSSTNSQPWHFVIAGTDEGRQRVAKAAHGVYAFNASKICDASHVVVLCTKTDIDTEYTTQVLEQEERDGRFPSEETKAANRKGREFFAMLHRNELQDAFHWMEKQTFIALGNLLSGAAHLGIHACPMEGFDHEVLEKELGLTEKGYKPSVIVALGFSAADDFNAVTPKSRWPQERIITEI